MKVRIGNNHSDRTGQKQGGGAAWAHGLKTTSVNLYSPVCRAASTRKKDRCHPYGCGAQLGP